MLSNAMYYKNAMFKIKYKRPKNTDIYLKLFPYQ